MVRTWSALETRLQHHSDKKTVKVPVLDPSIFSAARSEVVPMELGDISVRSVDQDPAVDRAILFLSVCSEVFLPDSIKAETALAGMGFAKKNPWAEPQPANANSCS